MEVAVQKTLALENPRLDFETAGRWGDSYRRLWSSADILPFRPFVTAAYLLEEQSFLLHRLESGPLFEVISLH